ncbi:MAG: arylsulfatase [Planctomycetota bacterium]
MRRHVGEGILGIRFIHRSGSSRSVRRMHFVAQALHFLTDLPMHSRTYCLFIFVFALIGWCRSPASAHEAPRPNIVIVMTDDQGYGDLGWTGNPVLKTPVLDRLAGESLRLSNYHVSPTCSPTRAALMTGKFSNRTGVWHTIAGRSLLSSEHRTMAEVFTEAGYRTSMFGKWHLGDNAPMRAHERGFENVLCHGGGGVGQTPDYWDNAYFDDTYFRNGKPESHTGFCTDVFFEAAIDEIGKAAADERPFLVYLAPNAAHGPMHAPPEFSAPYESQGTKVANFFGMIANIDFNMGRLLEAIDSSGQADNTLVIFTTDNGTASGSKVYNAGMRAAKGSEYDGGHRVPMTLRWPAAGWGGGVDIDTLAAHVDMLPTLMDVALGQEADESVDGQSIAELLNSPESSPSKELAERILVTDSQRILRCQKYRKSATMMGTMRLINGKELYDLSTDPAQKRNIADKNPELVQRLLSAYDGWWESISPASVPLVAIPLTTPDQTGVVLTCHDWVTEKATPWNQASIRDRPDWSRLSGYWNVMVDEPGTYAISLRRYPLEVSVPLDSEMMPGADVPGVQAYRARVGKAIKAKTAKIEIHGVSMEKDVAAKAESVDFEVRLPEGQTTLTATFVDAEGTEYGVYYAVVKRVAAGE